MYRLIYYQTGKFKGFNFKKFNNSEQVKTWIKEMAEKIIVIELEENYEEHL